MDGPLTAVSYLAILRAQQPLSRDPAALRRVSTVPACKARGWKQGEYAKAFKLLPVSLSFQREESPFLKVLDCHICLCDLQWDVFSPKMSLEGKFHPLASPEVLTMEGPSQRTHSYLSPTCSFSSTSAAG